MMYLKKYSIASLILIALVGWYVFGFITQESLTIDFFGMQSATLSIALWVAIPMFALYVASLFHMAFYSLKNSMLTRKYEKDFDKIVDAMVDAYLSKENRSYTYKTNRYKILGALVDNSKIFPKNFDANVENKKISDVLNIINRIRSGEVVELKKYALLPSNEFVIQNERNRYKKGDINAESILSHSNKYDESLCREVFVDYVKKAQLSQIQKYQNFMTKESMYVILSRINADNDTLIIENEVLISMFKGLNFTRDEYIEVSKKLSKSMLPEQRMKLFEILSNESDYIMDAYLYTLFDLEMLSMAKEILSNSQENEFVRFKIYRDLRECSKHYNIALFI